ncbi:MAG: thioredoxin domain-containing protein [Firmicutes bacterium HGW-Firmicutes-1]|jgi:hypothetical protein|nr:MAG: thioredoxin domain-containing protein [Firmicutes bacterium HGW-Firmicutes-1]
MNIQEKDSDSKKQYTNHLIHEKSPYLLQHAHNPVNWYPWSDEAFEKATSEDKAVFLSIGYSTCHWCHVMERESFEDEDVAKVLNNKYISIKVDREERPDIDQIYMSFCQATTGSGGWPLSVFLTSDKKPFYAGTYFPKKSRHGMRGFIDILQGIYQKWDEDREEVEDSAEKMVYMINQMSNAEDDAEEELDEQIFHQAYNYFKKSFDDKYGGFGQAPKFPTPHNLLFLLRYFKTTNNQEALNMVEKTLIQIYKGGIFDHIGFGFSRYSTDRRWLAPHFEKMLYDNALLLMAYNEAYQATQKPIYKEIAEKIIAYVIRDMTSPEGGFYCAEDADSEGVEGKFYIWSKEEIVDILGDEDGNLYCKYYDITRKGNFEEENIPNLIDASLATIEADSALKEHLSNLSQKLFEVRKERIHPYKDDKILTAWNGLMIAAMASSGKIMNNSVYIEHAQKAIQFIEEKLIREDGRLLSRYRDGEAKNLAFLEDYAFLIWSYIELYQAVLEPQYLQKAIKLTEDMIVFFDDEKAAGFFLYGKDSEQLIARPKEIYDGALPSGNSVATYTLLMLSKLTGNEMYEEKANQVLKYFSSKLKEAPMAYTMMLCARMYAVHTTKEIVLAGNREDKLLKEMINSIHMRYLPFATILLNDGNGKLEGINDFASKQIAIDEKATAYICENFTCHKPIFNLNELNELMN